MWQAYHSVSSVSEALNLLDEHGPAARIVAGGTDLIIEMERGQHPQLQVLVDITRVPGLDAISQEDDAIVLGPLVTHNHVVGSELIRRRALPLAQASWEVGAPQIRNRATIAGNLITASPANDTITPLVALGAQVTLLSADGERTLNLEDFYSGFRQTVLRPNELLNAIRIPPLADQQRGIFLKLGLRRAQAISVVDVAAVIGRDAAGIVTDACIALGSVAATIVRAFCAAEKFLIGKSRSIAIDDGGVRASGQLDGNANRRCARQRRVSQRDGHNLGGARAAATGGRQSRLGLAGRAPDALGRKLPRLVQRGMPGATVHLPDTPIESRVNGQGCQHRQRSAEIAFALAARRRRLARNQRRLRRRRMRRLHGISG